MRYIIFLSVLRAIFYEFAKPEADQKTSVYYIVKIDCNNFRSLSMSIKGWKKNVFTPCQSDLCFLSAQKPKGGPLEEKNIFFIKVF